LAVADAAARLPEGLSAVQVAALDLAEFHSAPPQLEHRLLSLLIAEGALTLLLTNWDNCVERSRQDAEPIPAARDDREAEDLRGAFILKIHGCCTRPPTLLVTSDQLGELAGQWTKVAFQARLAESTMIFVGIGDVAHYARTRINELAALVDHARIRVVSPSIHDNWDQSAWREILPTLPVERRIKATARDFLDQLAREWVMQLVDCLRASDPDSAAVTGVTTAFGAFSASEALEWLRRASVEPVVGTSVVRDSAAESLLEAIGLLAREHVTDGAEGADEQASIRFLRRSAVLIYEKRFEAMICRPRRTTTDLELAASERAQDYVALKGARTTIEILVAASSVRGPRPTCLPAVSVVDPETPVDDLLAHSEQVRVNLTYTDDVLAAA